MSPEIYEWAVIFCDFLNVTWMTIKPQSNMKGEPETIRATHTDILCRHYMKSEFWEREASIAVGLLDLQSV